MSILVPCDTCKGFGTVTLARDTGVVGTGYFYEELCPTCEGACEIEALCPFCDGPVDDDTGYCPRCREVSVNVHPLSDLRNGELGLTQVHSDPLKKKAA